MFFFTFRTKHPFILDVNSSKLTKAILYCSNSICKKKRRNTTFTQGPLEISGDYFLDKSIATAQVDVSIPNATSDYHRSSHSRFITSPGSHYRLQTKNSIKSFIDMPRIKIESNRLII